MTVREGLDNLDMLQQYLTADRFERARSIIIDTESPDQMVFMPTSNEEFKVSTYMELCLLPQSKVPWSHLVRNKITPERINSFMWRVYMNALPVDSNIQ